MFVEQLAEYLPAVMQGSIDCVGLSRLFEVLAPDPDRFNQLPAPDDGSAREVAVPAEILRCAVNHRDKTFIPIRGLFQLRLSHNIGLSKRAV